MQIPRANKPFVRNLFFLTGIIATFSYRAIIVLNHIDAAWVTIAWYVGTAGFIIYFIHRYRVSEKRTYLIRQHNLIQKVAQSKEFSSADQAAMEYIVGTLVSTKEKWNYIFIFVTSGIALIVGIVLDFFVS